MRKRFGPNRELFRREGWLLSRTSGFKKGLQRATRYDVKLVTERVVAAMREGATFSAACKAAGFNQSTGFRWLQRGEGRGEEEALPEFVEFARAVRQAEAKGEIKVVGHWTALIPGNWQAARDFLARRFPSRWGGVERRKVEVERGPVQLQLVWGDGSDGPEVAHEEAD